MRHTNFAFGDDRGGHVDQDRVTGSSGCGKSDGVRAQFAIDTAEGWDLSAQATGIDEGHAQQSLPGQRQRIGTDAAQVAAVAQRHRRHAMVAHQGHGAFDSQASGDGAQGTTPIEDRRGAPFAHNPGPPRGIEGAGKDLIHILIEPQCSVGIVPEETGLHQMLSDRPGIFPAATGRLKKGAADARQ